MLTKRIIACLDVDAGRVVKGVQFSDLRDAGDPAELALTHGRAGADEVVLLDISATTSIALLCSNRAPHGAPVVHSIHGGRRNPVAGRCGGSVRCRSGQGQRSIPQPWPIPR